MKEANIKIPKNTTKAYKLKFKYKATGLCKDITDWTVYFTAKASRSDSDASAVISKSQSVHDYPEQGITIITITATESNIATGNYWYSIDYKDNEGNTGIIATGKLKIDDTVRDTRE